MAPKRKYDETFPDPEVSSSIVSEIITAMAEQLPSQDVLSCWFQAGLLETGPNGRKFLGNGGLWYVDRLPDGSFAFREVQM